MVGVSQRRVSHADGLRWLIAQNTAVVNNSWGPSIARYFPMAIAEEQAVADGMTQGRGGKGMLLLYAAGNDRLLNAESNPYSAHPETVTVSGSDAAMILRVTATTARPSISRRRRRVVSMVSPVCAPPI